MSMQHHSDVDSRLVKGLVLDHGARNPEMPKAVKNAFILTCNVSLELEKSVDNVVMVYKTAQGREEMVHQERKFVDDRVAKIVELKRQVCDTPEKSFVVVNQKGIDPPSLAILAQHGILALRRAKRRNMERMTLACGGVAVNSLDELSKEVLGFAQEVYQHKLGEEVYTFVEGVNNPFSCTILLKGPNKHSINQVKDAIRDGVRAVKNAIEEGTVLPGAGAFEVAAHLDLLKYKEEVKGRQQYGIQAFANALLIIPKTLATNSGLDTIDAMMKLIQAHKQGNMWGLDIYTGEPIDPVAAGIYDSFSVKKYLIENSSVLATQLLLVDEVLRARDNAKDAQSTNAEVMDAE